MLQRSWGMDGESETQDAMEILSDMGLVKQDVRQKKGREEIGVRLHYLVNDHFAIKANGRKEELQKRLLNNSMRVECEENEVDWCREWWRVREKEDMYVYQNIVPQLLEGNMVMEAKALVLDPGWTVQQMRCGGRRHTMNDYSEVIGALEKRNSERDEEEVRSGSSMIEALGFLRKL
ncbi:hypothetical protein BWQ96_09298 [Gracilariopsis chorda]|uniref:APAF-1 helical domain-containing protein n=1 Tax=Gracilariopsis chorda TaxID=448386 RepID=A0A2V3IG35_9FLOR|nr:hypothetical protein BWQ96_09298 [Gracilariopsis chorda]|eukprot:PXF41003.1 hypothetical protein BWQ96_09298 [Gracilariopsis chorda]